MEDNNKIEKAMWQINYHVQELEKERKYRREQELYLVNLIRKAFKPEKEIDASTIANIQEAVKNTILNANYNLAGLEHHQRELRKAQDEHIQALREAKEKNNG